MKPKMQHSHPFLLPSDFFLVGVVDFQVAVPVLSFVVALSNLHQQERHQSFENGGVEWA